MKKLRLDADRLSVESFQTGDGDRQTPAYDLLATRPAACDPFSLPPRCS